MRPFVLATVAGAVVMLTAPSNARAERPDMGGDLHSFEPTDVLAFTDSPSGRVRVHYSVDGPNTTRLADTDADGVPDLPQTVASTADAVLDAFVAAGFRAPLAESSVGLGPLGGTDAFDFYLVDFGGGADGLFSVDGCRQGLCAGHMLIDNDFVEYNYPSVPAAIRVLASHEMFHAVQAAYRDELPVWLSEGTAVWAEDLFQPGVQDFLDFASSYLSDADRPIDRPPVGPVPAFAYGTCLFWKYLTLLHGDAFLPALLTRAATREPLDALEDTLLLFESDLSEAFIGFTAANLNTGARTNDEAIYPFAARLYGLEAESRGETLSADHRFYPLSATYWTLAHPGGPVDFGTSDEATGLVLTLQATTPAGKLLAVVATWEPVAGEVRSLGDLPEGRYWLSGTYPQRASQSRKILFCLGGAEALSPCGLTAGPPDAAYPDASLADAAADDDLRAGDADTTPQDAAEFTPDADETGSAIEPGGGRGGSGGGCTLAGRPRPMSAAGLAVGAFGVAWRAGRRRRATRT